jgi:hypothetical protein
MESRPLNELREATIRLLESRGLKPRTVPRGSVTELLGGLACMDLDEGGNIDSALLLARGRASDPDKKYILNLEAGVNIDSTMLLAGGNIEEPEQRLLCRIDYAVRGDIQGIRSGRRITSLRAVREGLLRKKVKDHDWVVPREQDSQPGISFGAGGAPPAPGEVWEGGPHQVLVGLLNGDSDLMDGVRALAARLGDVDPLFSVFSDRWGESLRVSGGPWVRADELAAIHASEQYLMAVDRVCGHIRETRRRFGGLTF